MESRWMDSYAFERSGGPATTRIDSLTGVQLSGRKIRSSDVHGTT
jgi:hypothetical protein